MPKLHVILVSLLLMFPLPALPKEDDRKNTNTGEGISTEIELSEVKDNPNSTALEAIDGKDNLKARLPLNALRNFAEAFNRVSSAYVEEIDDRTLLENAIKGMLSQLDPHSVYLDKNALSNLEEKTTGNYGGLGIEITIEDGFVKVIAPMDGTPADKADIEAGDLIIQLDEKPVRGLSLSESIDIMRGEPGSEIKLLIIRDGQPAPNEVILIREVINVSSVSRRVLDLGYGYLRIAQFQSGTGREALEEINKLKKVQDLKGLVIDLRDNPGGILQSAVEISDLFIEEGLIVYTEGRLANAELRFNASTGDSIEGIPIVVLVNQGTASASEIVAGALQDHRRAIIMGTTTFGKGSVQTVLPLNDEKAIKLTTARYFTPKGRSIQAAGIEPDIWVEQSIITPSMQKNLRPVEKNLPKHLISGNGGDSTESRAKRSLESATRDYQLNEALILLKGINILYDENAES